MSLLFQQTASKITDAYRNISDTYMLKLLAVNILRTQVIHFMFAGNGFPFQPIHCHAPTEQFYLLGKPSFTQNWILNYIQNGNTRGQKKTIDNCCIF